MKKTQKRPQTLLELAVRADLQKLHKMGPLSKLRLLTLLGPDKLRKLTKAGVLVADVSVFGTTVYKVSDEFVA